MMTTEERHRSLSVEVGVPVPMRDGTRLVADVFRPAGAGRWPVVLLRTPYDRRLGAASGQQLNAVRLAAAGYAVVIQDVRGRFGSGGEFYPFADEGRAPREVGSCCRLWRESPRWALVRTR